MPKGRPLGLHTRGWSPKRLGGSTFRKLWRQEFGLSSKVWVDPNFWREAEFFSLNNQSLTRSWPLDLRGYFEQGIKWHAPLSLDFGLGLWRLHTMPGRRLHFLYFIGYFRLISLDSQQSLATQSHGLSTWTAIVWTGPNKGTSCEWTVYVDPIEKRGRGFMAVMYVVDDFFWNSFNSGDLTLELALLTLNYSSEVNLKWLCQKPGQGAFTRHFSMAATNPKPNCMQMLHIYMQIEGPYLCCTFIQHYFGVE
jgi:hypothetical protein